MNKFITGVLAAGLVLTGAQAFAGDTQPDHMSKDQMMKECMSRMTAKNNGSTMDQMKEACKAEMSKDMNKEDMNKEGMSDKDNMTKPH